nr:hypothetical protein [Escherichia coli]
MEKNIGQKVEYLHETVKKTQTLSLKVNIAITAIVGIRALKLLLCAIYMAMKKA